jgi:hypothetical protein
MSPTANGATVIAPETTAASNDQRQALNFFGEATDLASPEPRLARYCLVSVRKAGTEAVPASTGEPYPLRWITLSCPLAGPRIKSGGDPAIRVFKLQRQRIKTCPPFRPGGASI